MQKIILSFLVCFIFFSAHAFAANNTQIEKISLKLPYYLKEEKRVERFQKEVLSLQAKKPNALIVYQADDSVNTLNDDVLYPNKNFYIFLALGSKPRDEGLRKTDWAEIYSIMNYLAELKFRVIINTKAKVEHLKYAVEDKKTSIILWSSHGNQYAFYDDESKPIPYDIFKNRSENFYQFILGACKGRLALDTYYDYSGLLTWGWMIDITSQDLGRFLRSNNWDAFEKAPDSLFLSSRK